MRLSSFLTIQLALLTVIGLRAQDDARVDYPQALAVEDLGADYVRDPLATPDYLFFAVSNTGGTTSIRAVDSLNLKWKTQGYYQRNRELGQTFSIPGDTSLTLDALVVRTGNSRSAVLANTPGAAVHLQLFEVIGEPVINDNGTPMGTDAEHGYTTNHRADDYLEGLTYRSLFVARGGVFPDIPPTDQNGGQPGRLRYLRFELQGEAEVVLEGGKRYAWLLGFDITGPGLGFSLGNDNGAGNPAAPELRTDARGAERWSMRREGDGTLPPTRVPGDNPPTDAETVADLRSESLFQPGYEWDLPPTTDGWPDVDTYRTMEFYLEVSSVDTTAADTTGQDTTGQDTTAQDTSSRAFEFELPRPRFEPNPTSGAFVVQIPTEILRGAGTVELRVTDATGRTILRRSLAATQARVQVEFDAPPPPGRYVVSLHTARGIGAGTLQIVR